MSYSSTAVNFMHNTPVVCRAIFPHISQPLHQTHSSFLLGNEFYLFVSHSVMKDSGSLCKLSNAWIFENLCVDPLSFITLWETNKLNSILITTILDPNCPILAMEYPFFNTQQGGNQNSWRSSWLIRHGALSRKNGCQNFSYVHST